MNRMLLWFSSHDYKHIITKTKLKSAIFYFLKASKPHITAYEFYGRALLSSPSTKLINSSGVNWLKPLLQQANTTTQPSLKLTLSFWNLIIRYKCNEFFIAIFWPDRNLYLYIHFVYKDIYTTTILINLKIQTAIFCKSCCACVTCNVTFTAAMSSINIKITQKTRLKTRDVFQCIKCSWVNC